MVKLPGIRHQTMCPPTSSKAASRQRFFAFWPLTVDAGAWIWERGHSQPKAGSPARRCPFRKSSLLCNAGDLPFRSVFHMQTRRFIFPPLPLPPGGGGGGGRTGTQMETMLGGWGNTGWSGGSMNSTPQQIKFLNKHTQMTVARSCPWMGGNEESVEAPSKPQI